MIADFQAYTIDVESYRNFFCIGLRDTTTGETRCYTSEPGLGEPLSEFAAHFAAETPDRLWIGFNSCGYGNHMVRKVLDGHLDPAGLFATSVAVIANDQDARTSRDTVDGETCIDLLASCGGKNGKVGSLKELAVTAGRTDESKRPQNKQVKAPPATAGSAATCGYRSAPPAAYRKSWNGPPTVSATGWGWAHTP